MWCGVVKIGCAANKHGFSLKKGLGIIFVVKKLEVKNERHEKNSHAHGWLCCGY